MEPPMPSTQPRDADNAAPRRAPAWTRWRPSVRLLLWALLAFVIGLLLFLALWWRDRGNDFYRAQAVPQAAEGQQFEPLPEPSPAGESRGTASGMEQPSGQPSTPAPRIIQAPAPVAQPRPAPAPEAVASQAASAPVPLQTPAPSYPPEAFRNGESGTVLLRVHVDPQGIPYGIDLVQSSRSRTLDRAASQAVQRWRFRPATRGGQPVAGEVQVPITFSADR
jgi:periplasmic protein TonB